MKTNITFICVLQNYSNNVAKLLGEKLDMFYVDVEDMLDFELGDTKHILSVLGAKEGKKYIKQNEVKVIKNIASFENTIISIKPSTLFSNRNLDRIKKSSYIIYLQISPKFISKRATISKDEIDQKLLELAFTDQDKIYVDSSDIVVNCSTFKEKKAVKKILTAINDFFKKQKKDWKDS